MKGTYWKPQPGVPIHRGHPHTVGLAHAFLLNERTGRSVRDAVSGMRGTFNSGTPTWRPGLHGGALSFDGASDVANFTGAVANVADNTTGFAVIAGVIQTGSQAGFQTIWANGDRGLYLSGGNIEYYNLATTNVAANSPNVPYLIGASGIGSSFTAHTFLMRDGVEVTGSVFGTPNLDVNSKIGGHGSEFFIGDISFVYVYNRYVSRQMMQSIHADPFAMFHASRTRLLRYVIAAGAGGGGGARSAVFVGASHGAVFVG